MYPAKRNLRSFLGSCLSSLIQPPDSRSQPTQILLRFVPFTRKPSQALDPPPPDQKLKNVRIVFGSVNTEPLSHGGEVVKEVIITPIVHQVSRHRDFLPHHIRKGHHSAVRINLEKLLNYLGVSCLVTLLVCSYCPADLR